VFEQGPGQLGHEVATIGAAINVNADAPMIGFTQTAMNKAGHRLFGQMIRCNFLRFYAVMRCHFLRTS
jgi:hypothetical protein